MAGGGLWQETFSSSEFLWVHIDMCITVGACDIIFVV